MRAKIIPQPSRPFRFVVPQGDGGPFPVGLRFRKLQGRCQMSQLTYRSFASRRPARYLFRAELDCGRFRLDFVQKLDTWPNRRTSCCGWPTEIFHCRG